MDYNRDISQGGVETGHNGSQEEHDGRNVSSYGVSIDTSNIKSVSLEQQDEELQLLDIDVYEQEQFERGVFRQVNSAFSQAEKNFKRNIIKKEIIGIEHEIKLVKEERDDIDKIFSSAKEGNTLNQISFSLLQQKQSKDSQVKRLESELLELLQKLDQLNDHNDNNDMMPESQDESVRLGEITPFEALQQKRRAQNVEKRKQDESVRLGGITSFNVLQQKCKVDTQVVEKENATVHACDDNHDDVILCKDNASKQKTNNASDDEYIPDYHDVSSDDDDDDGFIVDVNERIAKVEKQGKRKKSSKKYVMRSTIDDGDFNSYRERMRKLHVKKSMKEACMAGEVMEKYNSSDFSSDDDSDDNVIVEDDFVLPSKIWNKLYRYQQVGVRWLWQLHNQQAGGIVGDEMGLGKTIQIIAFLAGLAYSKKGAAGESRNLGLGPVLIVCPATVMKQWVAEFHKWWPKFRVGVLHDSGSFSGKKPTLIKALNNHPGVLITTYAGVRINKKELYRYYWQYVILDEGHKIRNPDSDVTLACKQFDTPHRIILTGTPMQNSLKELWSLFDFVYPGRLGTLPVFMTEFSVPITMGGYANASAVQVQTAYKCSCVLKDTVNPYMLRRMKKDVKKNLQLPTKNEQVLFCKLTDEQKDLYKEYINSKEVESMLSGNMKVFPGLIKLRKICNHPDLVYLEEKKDKEKANNAQCSSSPVHVFDGGYGSFKRSGKMTVVESLLRIWNEKDHRVLLFSQSKQMLNILEQFVKTMDYTYLRMDGTTNIGSRQNLVKKFNQDKSIFVFLLTTRVGGLGLNLIGADRVVIYDPDWNPSTDTQARERAWRIGQERHVTVYRLMTTGTIEEKIYHRQIFKQFLINRVLTNPFQRRFFKSNDLYELFTLGDIGPMQSTETGAIFAGTGSEIRMRKKRKSKRRSGAAVSPKRSKSSQVESLSSQKETNSSTNRNQCSNLDSTIDVVEKIAESAVTENKVKTSGIEKNITKATKIKKRKKKKKKISVDGVLVDDVDKSEVYRQSEEEEEKEDEKREKQKNEDDVLMSLFRSSGLHSALRHDQIEQAGNPDYVLVEKEAEKVAKQAANALRQSRAQCKNNGLSVPTWTGHVGTSTDCSSVKKPRFGKKANKNNGDSSTPQPDRSSNAKQEDHGLNLESETIDVSSSALLARMRTRNMFGTASCCTQPQSNNTNPSKEDVLLKDIREFMLQQTDSYTTTDALTSFFSKRIEKGQNALFKQLLKQICTFQRRDDGVGTWGLKEEFL